MILKSTMRRFSYLLLLLICTLISIVSADIEYEDEDENSVSVLEKYVAGSTDDLGRLFELEKDVMASLDEFMLKNPKSEDTEKVQNFFQAHNIDTALLRSQDTLIYVAHPINAYHLMKRTTILWPELFENTSDDLYSLVEEEIERFPFVYDFNYGATFGILSVQLYYNLNFIDLANGLLIYPKTGEKFKSFHKLTSEDFILIAGTARHVHRFDKMVEWMSAAVQVAKKLEGANDLELRKLRKKVDEAKIMHDDILAQKGLGAVITLQEGAYDGLPQAPIFTESRPYDEELADSPTYLKSRRKMKTELEISKPFMDIRPLDEKDPKLFMEKSFHRMWHTLQPISRRLCNGDTSIRSPEYDLHLKCVYLHYFNPYLRLGPFKYEPLNSDPHVGIFRDFYSDLESGVYLNYSQGRLHSTEYVVNGESRYYTSQRVSKRHNLDEDEYPAIMGASRKLSLASRWMVHQKTYSAEDYKMINYGLGGHIEVHVDYWGPGRYLHPGGARYVTFMGYMTDVTAGGFTIFPGLGLFVQPAKGDALFWLTVKNDLEYDSRMFHLGCPVFLGHKWVLTKWLYADDQMWNHPCDSNSVGNYPIFSNNQRHRDGFKV